MGAALIIVPVFVIIAGVIWVMVAAGKTSKARQQEQSLPDDSGARREEELSRLRNDHAEAGSPHVEN